jgi:hypothetical protein
MTRALLRFELGAGGRVGRRGASWHGGVARAEKGAPTVSSCTMHARLRAINVGHSCRKEDVINMARQQLQTREEGNGPARNIFP